MSVKPKSDHLVLPRKLLQALFLLPAREGPPRDLPLPNIASPAAATAAGGAALAGAAWLIRRLILGAAAAQRYRPLIRYALLGASPGALWGLLNVLHGKSVLSQWPHGPSPEIKEREPLPLPRAWPRDPSRRSGLALANTKSASQADELFPVLRDIVSPFVKASMLWQTSPPPIELDSLRRAIWTDPRVADRLPMSTRVLADAATRMADAAGNASGFVTPAEMGRLALGMGQGWLSGALVGRALGALTGLSESAQQRLRDMGTYAGAIKVLIPRLFGR